MKGWVLFGIKLVARVPEPCWALSCLHRGGWGQGTGDRELCLHTLPHELGTASPLLFSFREAAAGPANIYREKTGFNLTLLGKEDADGVKGAFATR